MKINVKEVGVGQEVNPYHEFDWGSGDARERFNEAHPPLPALDTKGNPLPVGEYEVELEHQVCSMNIWYKIQEHTLKSWEDSPTRQVYIATIAQKQSLADLLGRNEDMPDIANYTYNKNPDTNDIEWAESKIKVIAPESIMSNIYGPGNNNYGRDKPIESVVPESKEVNDNDYLFHCNGCGKAMEDEDIAFTNDDGYDYCDDCNEAIKGDPESAAGLIDDPTIDEAVSANSLAKIEYPIINDYSIQFNKIKKGQQPEKEVGFSQSDYEYCKRTGFKGNFCECSKLEDCAFSLANEEQPEKEMFECLDCNQTQNKMDKCKRCGSVNVIGISLPKPPKNWEDATFELPYEPEKEVDTIEQAAEKHLMECPETGNEIREAFIAGANHIKSTHVPIGEANAIKLRNLSLEKQYWLNISNGVKHNNIVIVDTFFAPDEEIEADFFHSKDTNIKRLSSNAVDLFIRLIKQGYTVRFLDDSAKRIVKKLSPPIYDKYYSLIKPQ